MKDGGSAFPVLDAKYGYDGEHLGLECVDRGATLRDWFATSVLVKTAVSLIHTVDDPERAMRIQARNAYAYADAMIEAREDNNVDKQT